MAPQLRALGLSVPDPHLRHDEASGNWIYGPIDWDEFWRVVKGNGPCNQERLGARRQAHEDGRWVREAMAAYARKKGMRAR
jgi:ring-1,2-phenylacetyl-CoA epoxidase subunit PaaA